MGQRRLIKCKGNVSVNVCNLKQGDILIIAIPNRYKDVSEYENLSSEAEKLSDNLKKDLGFRIPVIVIAGDVSFKTMNKKELLDMINRD